MRFFPFLLSLVAAAAPLPKTSIKAEHYDALNTVLIKGDIVYAFAIRDPVRGERPPEVDERRPAPGQAQVPSWKTRALPKTVWNEEKYARRVQIMNGIKDPKIEKMIILSSVEDLKTNLSRLPKDLTWVAYNSEPGMTPQEELLNIENSVLEFAKIAHGAGLKVSWGPTNFMLAEDEAKFLGLAKHIDAMGLQHQRTLQYEGVEAFVSLTKTRSEKIKAINPKCRVEVQAVIGRGKNEDIVKALRAVASYVDNASVWTMQDTAAAMEILHAVRK